MKETIKIRKNKLKDQRRGRELEEKGGEKGRNQGRERKIFF